MPGMGGININCRICKGEGVIVVEPSELYKIVEAIPEAVEPVKAAPVEVVEPVKKIKIDVPVEAMVETLPLDLSPIVTDIFPGYSNDMMQALFDENKMDAIKWRQKYKGIKELFKVSGALIDEVVSKVERNAIRELYARSKPVAPRVVDTLGMQDAGVGADKDYSKYKAQEDIKAAKALKGKV